MTAHYQVTRIHEGQSFESDRLYNEHFSVFKRDSEKWQKKALAALKKSAEAIIPKKLMKDVMFSSIDFWGRRIFSWRFGTQDWVDIDLNAGFERQVYAN